MRYSFFAGAAAAIGSGAAYAADKPVIGPAPAWVKAVVAAPSPAKADNAAVRLLLVDQQVSLEPGRQTVYSELIARIQTPQGLAAGNISLPWRPDTDVLTVHKLLIRRGATVIDVLKSGQTFTVVRREANLESATLDGVLTANIQPEGLQVGDVLEFAASVTSSDPVMKGHVEQIAATWNGIEIGRAHLRMQWPATLAPKVRESVAMPVAAKATTGGMTSLEIAQDDLAPLVLPKGAPLRYQLGRFVEVSDFGGWADMAALLAPLYRDAARLPAAGPLHTEIDRIRALSPDRILRTQAALALVQDKVRYVALAMGAGGMVPANVETTWSRRYGDCKAKTVLLLAILHALQIEADAVIVNTVVGDGIDARLPMIGLFNHVLVRATIAGRTYWLDGTRTGDTSLDRLAIPNFGWGLPLLPVGAALVRIVPAPLAAPTQTVTIRIDATAGLTMPAPTKVETVLTGDDAFATNLSLANLTGDARDRALREYWQNQYDFIDVQSVAATFDPRTGEQRLSMAGLARMEWKDGWYTTDGTAVGYKADFRREAGVGADAPYAVPFPYYTRNIETILLPPGFAGWQNGAKTDVETTVAGIEYRRRTTMAANVFTAEKSERSVAAEFPAKDAPAAQAALRKLADQTVYLRQPDHYRPTAKEVTATLGATPVDAQGFVTRGSLMLDQSRYDEAISDFDHALALDAKDGMALANRGLAHVWKQDYPAAAKDLDAAQAVDPRNANVFRARGLMAQQKGDSAAAVAAYTTALGIEPEDGFALGHRAQAYRAAGQVDAALADAAAALKRNPGWFDLYLLRANTYRNQGKPDQALAEAAAMVAANPDQSYAHVAAANIYRALGNEADAMRAYDRALAIKPEAYIYVNRGMTRPKGDKAGRRADYDAALALDPTSRDALSGKARLLAEAGDQKGAIDAYSIAILTATDPDDTLMPLSSGASHMRG